MLTTLPGSSAYYRGGVCCYSNEAKRDLLGVSDDQLKRYGAVSEAVAIELAQGCQKKLGADLGLSFTGIAGPDGGSTDKPVGTVWCAICYHGRTESVHLQLSGDRHQVRWQATVTMLNKLLNRVRTLDAHN